MFAFVSQYLSQRIVTSKDNNFGNVKSNLKNNDQRLRESYLNAKNPAIAPNSKNNNIQANIKNLKGKYLKKEPEPEPEPEPDSEQLKILDAENEQAIGFVNQFIEEEIRKAEEEDEFVPDKNILNIKKKMVELNEEEKKKINENMLETKKNPLMDERLRKQKEAEVLKQIEEEIERQRIENENLKKEVEKKFYFENIKELLSLENPMYDQESLSLINSFSKYY